jgi:hypothetical protein
MSAAETVPTPSAPDHLPAPASGAESSTHSADSLALFWIMVGLGGIVLAGLVNVLTGFLSR